MSDLAWAGFALGSIMASGWFIMWNTGKIVSILESIRDDLREERRKSEYRVGP